MKKHPACEKDYTWNPAKCTSENGKDLASIIGNSVICDEKYCDKYCTNKKYSTNINGKM